MTNITLEDIVLPGTVSIFAALQLTRIAKKVGVMRGKFKIAFPATTGEPTFERAFRAQQNTLEFMPIFMPCLWVSGIFFHPVPSALAGVVYLYSRHRYFEGYIKSVEDRLPGFKLGVRCLMVMLFMSSCGLSTTLLRRYADIDIAQTFWQIVEKYLPSK
ncbi:hypothetical protein LOTGIDRAFT_204965 [Lottia gigantea]|uniref:Glutathione transferase n=1 Tax=Lottia gigantea TaxID=225164 RepID=V4BEY7_LOTGI|nr:hypothetical protein LOTGIDRAFT_204965 [Lottia gigantea]ESP04392.1 hypothetical protein LOTGIDRAFT_204965 [Lottia gigantea]